MPNLTVITAATCYWIGFGANIVLLKGAARICYTACVGDPMLALMLVGHCFSRKFAVSSVLAVCVNWRQFNPLQGEQSQSKKKMAHCGDSRRAPKLSITKWDLGIWEDCKERGGQRL